MSVGPRTKLRLGDILIQMGILSQESLREAIAAQQSTGERLGGTLVLKGFCTEAQVLAALAAQHKLPTIDLARENPPHNLQQAVDSDFAEQHGVVPFREEKRGARTVYCVAIEDPRAIGALQDLEFRLKAKVEPYLALSIQVREKIRAYYFGQDHGYQVSFDDEGDEFQIEQPRSQGTEKNYFFTQAMKNVDERFAEFDKKMQHVLKQLRDRDATMANMTMMDLENPGGGSPSAQQLDAITARVTVLERTMTKVVQRLRDAPAGGGAPTLQGPVTGMDPQDFEKMRRAVLALIELLEQSKLISKKALAELIQRDQRFGSR